MISKTQETPPLFVGKLNNIKHFHSALRAISFNEDVTFQFTELGFKATVEQNKYVQASSYVTKACFTEYQLREDVTFRTNLKIIVDFLGLFLAPSCDMELIYRDECVVLILHDSRDGLMTECKMRTKSTEPLLEFAIDEVDFNLVILRGQDFAALLGEIDRSAEEIEILLAPEAPNFCVSTIGVMHVESKFEVARTSELFFNFDCKTQTVGRYRFSQMKLLGKALAIATKVAMRTDDSLLLGMQMMIYFEEDEQIYTEFFLTPLNDVN